MKNFSPSRLLASLFLMVGLNETTYSQAPLTPAWSLVDDQDQDGIRDLDEIFLGLDPFNPSDGLSDSDGDLLSLGWEFFLGTSPVSADTDGDGWSDSKEALDHATDPLNPLSYPQNSLANAPAAHAVAAAPAPLAAQPAAPMAVAAAPVLPPPSISNGDFTTVSISSWKSALTSKDYQGGGFKWGAGGVGAWTAYVGTTIEVWEAGGEKFVELDGSPGNYGIKQQIANPQPGGYVITWRHSGRNNTKAGANPYQVRVYFKNGTSETTIKSADFKNIDKLSWTDNALGFQISAAAATKPIYIAFIPTGTLDTYGTLIDKVTLLPVDLDFIKPGTEKDSPPEEISEDKEDSEGEVVGVNWDDDNNSEGNGGHAKLVFKNDFDDSNGTAGEDDLIQIKLHKPAVEGAKAKLKYDNSFVKVWLKPDRKEEVKSEETEIELTEDKIVFLEGRKITEAEKPKEVEMQVKIGTGNYTPGDRVSVHVATPIITCQAKINWVGGAASKNLAEQMHDKQFLGKYRRDDRNNTVILKGKNQSGKLLWYSVDMVDIRPKGPVGDIEDPPVITVRTPNLDKEFKMALGLEGAHVFCNGHSNYGLGPNFTPGGTTTVDDYTNLSGRGITAITMKSTDPDDGASGNPMLNLDHGGPNFALRDADIVSTTKNYIVPALGVLKFEGQTNGATLTKHIHTDGTPFHYLNVGKFQNWNTIVKSFGDVPTLRYASCFTAGCNTGRAFSESLNHGILLFTLKTSQMQLGRDSKPIPGDKATAAPGQAPMSWVDTHYVRMMVEGKSWDDICTFLNQNYSYPWPTNAQGNPVAPLIYAHKP